VARSRKKKPQESENLERWLVSYADFVTLLFAFFVVMYAISTINEGKYRVLSDTMIEAFSEPLKETPEVDQVPPTSAEQLVGEYLERQPDAPATGAEASQPNTGPSDIEPTDNRLWVVASNLDSSLQGFVDQDLVSINLQGDKIEVQLNNKMLFDSGSARLSANARKAFADIATIVKPLKNRIYVEGHTDNVPISTLVFPSNWELSAARAASVVNYLVRQGLQPQRLAAIGYGQYRPVAENTTEKGRSKNRRVTLIIRSDSGGHVFGELDQGEAGTADEGDIPWAESPGGL
jgi:chemotaxis protein MotB